MVLHPRLSLHCLGLRRGGLLGAELLPEAEALNYRDYTQPSLRSHSQSSGQAVCSRVTLLDSDFMPQSYGGFYLKLGYNNSP